MSTPTVTGSVRGGQEDHDAGLLYVVGAATAIGAVLLAVVGPPRVPMATPQLPNGAELELLVRTPTAAQLDGVLLGLGWLAWLLWLMCAWVAFTALFRAAVLLAEPAGASWLRPAHRLSDLLTFPAVRRAVDGLLAVLLMARVVTSSVAPPLAFAASAPVVAGVIAADDASSHSPAASQPDPTERTAHGEVGPSDLLYKVQHGDSVGRLAARFYGDWQSYTRIVEANRDRLQPDGMTFGETGTIHPGWTLVIPEPTHGVRIDEDGNRWYTVERGDTLWGISDELLGDGRRWPEVFELNRQQARLDDAHVLHNPNLIWPKLEVELPPDDRMPTAASPAPAAADEPAPPVPAPAPPPPVAPEAPRPAPVVPSPPPTIAPAAPQQEVAAEQPTVPPPAATPEPVATPEPTPVARPTGEPAAAPLAAAAAGGLAAAAIAAGTLVVRRRRPAPTCASPRAMSRSRAATPSWTRPRWPRSGCWAVAAATWPAWWPDVWRRPTRTTSTSSR
jgi:LysM domain